MPPRPSPGASPAPALPPQTRTACGGHAARHSTPMCSPGANQLWEEEGGSGVLLPHGWLGRGGQQGRSSWPLIHCLVQRSRWRGGWWGLLEASLPLPRGAGLSGGLVGGSPVKLLLSKGSYVVLQYFLCSQSLVGSSDGDNTPVGILTPSEVLRCQRLSKNRWPPAAGSGSTEAAGRVPPAEPSPAQARDKRSKPLLGGRPARQSQAARMSWPSAACCAGPSLPILQSSSLRAAA